MGTEIEKDNIIETSPGDEDLMLPEGYGAEDDLFADPSTWTGKQTDESAEESGDGEAGKDDEAEDAPTTAQDPAQDVQDDENAEAPTTEPPVPTTAQEKAGTAPNMLKFRAKLDHNEQDVELNESDLPGIWQKAQNHDRMQSRLNQLQAELQGFETLALTMGYANAKEMREKAANAYRDAEVRNLVDSEGVPERIAKFVVDQEMRQRNAATPQQQPQTAEVFQQVAPAARNPAAEVAQLLQARPELRGQQLPREVLTAAAAGKNLLLAYTEHENRQKAAEAEKAKQENDILKQNAANAAKAPVRGTAGGGAPKDKGGEDDFLRGFNSEY